MPMSFPDMESLKRRAKQRSFRQPHEGETEADYREAFACHMHDVDKVEAMEIRSGKGWDQMSDAARMDGLTQPAPTVNTMDAVAAVALDWMSRVKPDDRVGLIGKLTDEYCQHCGREHPDARGCQCWNDE